MNGTWKAREARARFSELVRAAQDGPQEITVRGHPAAVVVSPAYFERLRLAKLTFVEMIRESPLVGVDLDIRRDRSPAREVKL